MFFHGFWFSKSHFRGWCFNEVFTVWSHPPAFFLFLEWGLSALCFKSRLPCNYQHYALSSTYISACCDRSRTVKRGKRKKATGCLWCQTTSAENELGDNRKMDKSLNTLPITSSRTTHPPSQHSMSPPTIVPNSPSVQPANHRPVSIAMSQRSGVIKFLAAKRMKEGREGGKSRVGERGGGAGNMRNKMPVNTKAEQGLGVGDSFWGPRTIGVFPEWGDAACRVRDGDLQSGQIVA